jgi:hypothetical protein
MHVSQEAVLETLRGIQRFLDDNDATLGSVNQAAARQRLDEAVTQIASHAVAQVAGRRGAEGETAKQRALRLALRSDHMRPIALIAAQKLREQPEFRLLRMPPWSVRGAGLSAAAHDMANAAEKYTDLFVHEGVPTDFVAQLRTAADQLDQSVDVRGQSRSLRAGATEGLKAEAKRSRALIKVLDSLVRPKLGTNDELLRQWQVTSHVRRGRQAASTTTGGNTPTPAAPTTPAVSTTPGASTTPAAPTTAAAPTTPVAPAVPASTPTTTDTAAPASTA